ncbi:MAG TPA: sulfatase [Candidatus Dormibacteraeota bacterium]|nr:sulfatase [Candidatus Dormibacteraeota bacterium]
MRPEPTLTPLRMLFLTAMAMGAVMAVANVAYLAAVSDVAVPYNLEVLNAAFGSPGIPRFLGRVGSGSLLGGLLDTPFSLHEPTDLLSFLALATLATVALYLFMAILAAPFVALAARLYAPRAGDAFWGRVYPLAILAAYAAPLALVPARAWWPGTGATRTAMIAAGVALAAWTLLLAGVRRAEGVERLLRRTITAGVGAALVIWAAGAAGAAWDAREKQQPPAAAGRPNVLLVSIDSLRADHVHAYGYERETTPQLDALARDGTLFRTVVSPTSWTLPAHMTLLTALPPERHGVVADGQRLTGDATFLAEVLWRAGYATAGFVSAPYLDAVYGFSQGFDHYDDYTIAKRSFDDSHRGQTSPPLLGIVSDWLRQWAAGGRQRPFFAFVHMWDVHYDYTPPPPYDTMFDPDYRGSVTGEDYENGTQVHPGMDPRDLAHVVALYDGEIRYTDHYLGLLLDQLRALGVLDQTIVVVTADHGDEFFEHGRKGHKQALYDESILVPLIIRYPSRVPPAHVVPEQVRLMDVAPTIVALAGLPPQADFGTADVGGYAARDLTPWLTAPAGAAPPALVAYSDLVGDAPVPVASIRTPQLKLIQEQGRARNEELYDLATDPGEHHNLLPGVVAAAPELRQELADWRTAWAGHQLAEAVALSEAHKERLRALGYLK